MSDTTYLITLKPRGRFFFGGNRAFTASGEAIYSAESLYFPQQTALLGMLRLALLRQHDLLDKPNQQAEYIGIGFDPTVSDIEKDNKLGKIKSISPVFILDIQNNASWQPIGVDYQSDSQLALPLNSCISNYDPKKDLQNRWSSGGASCNMEDFFVNIETVGNKKARDGKSQPDGFFKQKSHQFVRTLNTQNVQLSFAFFATFSKSIPFDKISSVLIGADQSAFGFRATVATQPAENKSGTKIILLSDTYIDNYDVLKTHCDFILGQSAPFRYMTSPTSQEYFTGKRRSQNFNLLSRGTVLYPKSGQLANVEAKIQEATAFRQIGYNHFRIL